MRTIASIVYLLTSLVIALGAFGHDSNTHKLVEAFAGAPMLDAELVRVILAVWHFCSGCMFVFGVICLLAWRALRSGVPSALWAPLAIAVFYVVAGIGSVLYTGKPFFWLFTALGLLLAASAVALRGATRRS